MTETSTPVDPALLRLLRCPITRSELRAGSPEEVATANQRIAAGELLDASGEIVAEPLGGALITHCGKWIYAVRGQVPAMIAEQAIPAEQVLQRKAE